MSGPIHWHEGLFLQPHHLQAMQRMALQQVWEARRMHNPFPYGVVEARLLRDQLVNGHICFDRLTLVMRDGTVFSYPDTAELPSLDIRNAFQSRPNGFTVGLALPLWRAARPNTIPFGEARSGPAPDIRYQAHELKYADENIGENPQPIQVLRHNGRLMFADEPRFDTEFLPLVRVLPRASETTGGSRAVDPQFVPATILLSGSPVLFSLVRDLGAAVAAARLQLGEQMAANPFDLRALQGVQFEQVSTLRCLARGASLLQSLTDDNPLREGCKGRVPTYEAYLAMQDLLAELSSLHPAKRMFSWKPYDHDDPYPPFADLDAKIREFLNPGGNNFRKISFVLDRDIFYGDIPPGFFQDIKGCYLSMETENDPTALARLVADRDHFKLLPASLVVDLAVRGLYLVEERNVPADLPLRAGQYYYRVDTAATPRELWQRFQEEPRAALHFKAPDLPAYKVSLYVNVPPAP